MENREKKETENTNCDTSKDKNVINNDDFSSKNKVDIRMKSKKTLCIRYKITRLVADLYGTFNC